MIEPDFVLVLVLLVKTRPMKLVHWYGESERLIINSKFLKNECKILPVCYLKYMKTNQ